MLRGTIKLAQIRKRYKTKYSEELKEQMFDMYVNKEMTIEDIHEKLGIPKATIGYIVRKLSNERNIPTRRNYTKNNGSKKGRNRYKTKYSDELKEQMLDLYVNKEMTLDEIQEELGVPKATIGYIVRVLSAERNIPPRRNYDKNKPSTKGRKNKKYTEAQKLVALDRVMVGKEKAIDVSKDLDITNASVSIWVKGAKEDPNIVKILESNVSEKDHLRYVDNGNNRWYIDEDELRDLKQLLDEGKDLFTCSYIMGVEGKYFEKMLQAVNFL